MRICYINSLIKHEQDVCFGASLHGTEFIKAIKDLSHKIVHYPPPVQQKTRIFVDHAINRITNALYFLEAPLKYYYGFLNDFVFNGFVSGAADVIVARVSLANLSLIRYLAERGLPLVLEINAPIFYERCLHTRAKSLPILEKIELEIYKNATAIMVVSDELKNLLIRFGITGGKIFVNPNGVDSNRFHPSISPALFPFPPRMNGRKVVGYLGEVKYSQDIETLIEAFNIVLQGHEAHLVLAGKGTDSDFIRSHLKRLGIQQHVTCTGFVKRSLVPNYLALMDILVSPMNPGFSYMSPLKEFEYMAMGKPIVATDMGQASKILTNMETALLVKPKSPPHMALALNTLIEDGQLSKYIGDNARKLVLENYTWLHNAKLAINICKYAIKTKASGTKSKRHISCC